MIALLRGIVAALLAVFLVVPTQPSGEVLFDAPASRPFAAEWVAGNAYDVHDGEGTRGDDPAWAQSTRIRRYGTDGPVQAPPALAARGLRDFWVTAVEDGDDDYHSDPGSNQRTEMGMNSPPREMPDGVDRNMVPGRTYYIAYDLYVPSSYPDVDEWAAFNQNKCDNGGGNGPLGVYFYEGSLLLSKSQSQEFGSTDMESVWRSEEPVPRDTWLELMIAVHWSTDDDGWYALYGDLQDGEGFRTLKPPTFGWTLKHDCPRVGSRLGIYRAAIEGDHELYWAGFNTAESRAEATRFAFGETK